MRGLATYAAYAAVASILATVCGMPVVANANLAQAPSATLATADTVTTLLDRHSYPISLAEGRLAGPGAELLMREFGAAQFVAIGEDHNRLYIPQIAAALFRDLNRNHGFQYFATEQDPVTMTALSQPPLRGRLQAIAATARQEPFSFTFLTDQELELLAEVGRLSSASRPIWGCEQAFGATHILRRLENRASTPRARAHVAALRARAQEAERARDTAYSSHFLLDNDLKADLRELLRHFPDAGPETAFLLRALSLSSEVYGLFRAGQRGEVPGSWSNSRVREEYMKEICRVEYLAALEAEGILPKVMLKHGPWHLFEVSSPAHITTLGTFFSQLAVLNGTSYRSVSLHATSWNGADAWESESGRWMRVFAPIIDHQQWTVVDLRPFREYPNFRLLRARLEGEPQAMFDWLRRYVYGFDFLMFIGPGVEGTYNLSAISTVPLK